jgi:SCO1/SenC
MGSTVGGIGEPALITLALHRRGAYYANGDQTEHRVLPRNLGRRLVLQQGVLEPYVAQFHPRLIGLTGTPEQILAVAESYKAYYAKYPPPDASPYRLRSSVQRRPKFT